MLCSKNTSEVVKFTEDDVEIQQKYFQIVSLIDTAFLKKKIGQKDPLKMGRQRLVWIGYKTL